MTFMIVYLFIGNTLSIYTIFAIIQSLMSSVGGVLKVNKSTYILINSILTILRTNNKFTQIQINIYSD